MGITVITVHKNIFNAGGRYKPYGGRAATVDLLDLTNSGIAAWGQPQLVKRGLFCGTLVL